MVLLLFPSVVTVTLPMAFLLGLVLAIGRLSAGSATSAPRRWLGPALGLSIATGLFTFVLYGWVTPEANQSYRERVFRWVSTDQLRNADGRVVRVPADRRVPLTPKGTREFTLGELQTRIHDGRTQGQSTVALDVEWHKKWAIPAACLIFGPLAIGLHGLWKRPRTAMSFAIAVAATLLFYLALRIGEQSAINGRLGPLPAMWAGDALLALVTLWLIARAPRLRKDEAITA
jgi:lipopolysaccharide export LptBFGC system permease protein LptF